MGLFVELPTDSCNAINSDKGAIVIELILKRYVILKSLEGFFFAKVVAIDIDIFSTYIEAFLYTRIFKAWKLSMLLVYCKYVS